MKGLKPCPFCGGEARIKFTDKFKGSAGKAIVLFVDHDEDCIIRDKDEPVHRYVMFRTDSILGQFALEEIAQDVARRWNRRVDD